MALLSRNKIYYFLCKDADEIKQLTGFHTRGMYNVAMDYIITTYNTHYHELMHLLINFKLQELNLHSHPFLLEGFATALGGRAGKEPDVILNLGKYLIKSGLLDYSELLSNAGFYQNDASFSYPLSGLYNYFLLQNMEIVDYIKLYQKYSGNRARVEQMKISNADLPSRSDWQKFIHKLEFSAIQLDQFNENAVLIYKNENGRIYSDKQFYHFEMKDTLLIGSDSIDTNYRSNKFQELFPLKKYNGEKYAILVNASEISIYNLYNNNLVDVFIAAFSTDQKSVPQQNGFFRFSVIKDLFEDDILNAEIKMN